MTTTQLYGITNCDTVKKARKWLSDHQLDYNFHDLKSEGVSTEQLAQWACEFGWESLLNKRGTTWRKIPDEEKEIQSQEDAILLMKRYPSLIKRPVLLHSNDFYLGFKAESYHRIFFEKVS
ncbi:MAG: ArsC family reductase [Kangiellaceae bacterium]|nr:ArsC family reductase [Kangiellaceae bacterium]|tara:strand:+ start:9629 stop:9991 length:363 start_codon:yes stop_codon:yes gene_type:complete